MLSKRILFSIVVIMIIIISAFSTFLIFNNRSGTILGLKNLEPTLISSDVQIHRLLVFNADNYPTDYGLAIRSLQAVVNSQNPNGTNLFVIDNNLDYKILQEVYAKIPELSILQFNQGSNESINIANLINYFSFLIKGFVYFNSTSKIFYPAVINFLANYPNTIAIPYPDYSLLPTNLSSLRVYNFINKTSSASFSKIANYYQNQINTFNKNLHGTNLWDYQSDNTAYFDFVISQKYFTFPSELLNGSFPTIEKSIKDLTNSFYNKAILNEWPNTIARISVPIYQDINTINNLSFYIKPFSFTFPLNTTFESVFSSKSQNSRDGNQTITEGNIGYSLLLNNQNNSINFLFDDVLNILLTKPSFFDNTSLVIPDSVFFLLPELMYWLFSKHPEIHFIPKIEIGSVIQPIYFPQYFFNQTAFVQTNPTNLLRNDWNSSEYINSLGKHFKGLYVTENSNVTSQFKIKQKLVNNFITMSENYSNANFNSFLSTMVQNSATKAIIIAISGNDQFLLYELWAINKAIQFITSSSNASFVSLDPNTIFNFLS